MVWIPHHIDADRPANDTLAVLAKAEELLNGGANWMQASWTDDDGRLCLLGAVNCAMLETAQPLHNAEKFLAEPPIALG